MRTFKTNSKPVKEAIRAHIKECVTDYEGNQFKTAKEAAKHLNSEFERVANYEYNLKKFPNDSERFSDYLCGMTFSFEIYYHHIKDYFVSIGVSDPAKDYDPEKALRLYHYLIFREMKNLLK